MSEKNYRIVKLSASNIKRIKAIEILPTGNVITIGGKNDQGKTSLLDSILYAMGGQDSVCERPIREGATKGEIVVDLGDMIVTKTFKSASAPILRINLKDGTPVKSPQAILDALCSKISYNPMEWMAMKPDKQLELLSKLVGVDLAPFKVKRDKFYNDRTVVNRDLSQKQAKLATMPEHVDAPAEEVSVKALMEQLKVLRAGNAENVKVRDRVTTATTTRNSKQVEVTAAIKEIKDLEELLRAKTVAFATLEAELAELETGVSNSKEAADALKDADETPLNTQIEEADTVNSKVRDNAARKTLSLEVLELTDKEHLLTNSIEAVDADKEKALTEAKFPLPELSFDESGVLLDGIPFAQAGMAKKIRASVAIGLALNPKLRVILIRDGSLLDEDSQKLVFDLAKEKDAQVWMEVIGDGPGVSVVIEDGSIRES